MGSSVRERVVPGSLSSIASGELSGIGRGRKTARARKRRGDAYGGRGGGSDDFAEEDLDDEFEGASCCW